jgi:hypothetical protein
MTDQKILFIMGNGPSLKEIMSDPEKLSILKNNHTFGLNAAYRAYEKFKFCPTYFGCFDHLVNDSHKIEFTKLAQAGNEIKHVFFVGNRDKNQHMYPDSVYNSSKFIKFKAYKDYNRKNTFTLSKNFANFNDAGCSGANALQCGILMGYKKIALIGCDCNYIERIKGVKSYDPKMPHRLIVCKEGINHNPNYWFNEYQLPGDKFNLPNTNIYHLNGWKNIHDTCPKDVMITNLSIISKIPFFDIVKFTEYIGDEME